MLQKQIFAYSSEMTAPCPDVTDYDRFNEQVKCIGFDSDDTDIEEVSDEVEIIQTIPPNKSRQTTKPSKVL